MDRTENFPVNLTGDSIAVADWVIERLETIRDSEGSTNGMLKELLAGLKEARERAMPFCDCCGLSRCQPGRRNCDFCSRLYRRINYIADRVGCLRPTDAERETIVARLAAIHSSSTALESRTYLGFAFPEDFFVQDSVLDYRLLFHSDNVILFDDRGEYDAHRDELSSIKPEYLRSKFAAWTATCLRTSESAQSIKRRLTRARLRASNDPTLEEVRQS